MELAHRPPDTATGAWNTLRGAQHFTAFRVKKKKKKDVKKWEDFFGGRPVSTHQHAIKDGACGVAVGSSSSGLTPSEFNVL